MLCTRQSPWLRCHSDFTLAVGGNAAFVWDAVDGATSYVLQVGTSTGQSDTYNTNVGNVLTHSLTLGAGTYYSRVVPYTDSTPGEATSEQTVTVA